MGIEIERKFLVKDIDYILGNGQHFEVTQGYLSLDPKRQVRVRITSMQQAHEARTYSYITVKGEAEGFTVPEFEYPIPYLDACSLLKICVGEVITKERYRIGRWEVDIFKGSNLGLVVAEIELTSEDEVIPLPFWVGKEVTGDHCYSNVNLATKPFNTWSPVLLDLHG
jgi:CYTH domain-containing protein